MGAMEMEIKNLEARVRRLGNFRQSRKLTGPMSVGLGDQNN